jgi:hypothetical protein
MEYLLGSLVTLLFVLIQRFIKYNTEKLKIRVSHTQSYIHNLVYPYSGMTLQEYPVQAKITQSYKLRQQTQMRVLVIEEKAYWISNNTVFVADMVDGEVDSENAKPVDTMGMDSVQLDRMMFIVETLTEGTSNDYRGPGYN